MLNLILRLGSNELKSSISLLQRRNFIFRTKTSEKTYRRKDKIEEAFKIIYKAPMEIYIKSCNYITTLSAVVFTGFAIYQYMHRFEPLSNEQKEFALSRYEATLSDQEVVYFAACLFVFCVAIRITLYRYPLRIYKNNTSFIAVFEGHLPATKEKVIFEKGNVRHLKPSGVMPWKDHRYMINDRKSILYYEYFRTPAELENMCTAPKKAK